MGVGAAEVDCRMHPQSVRTLKIPRTGSHIPVSGHTIILHIRVEMGSAALADAVSVPKQCGLNFPHGIVKY